jgi:hypothetical protein
MSSTLYGSTTYQTPMDPEQDPSQYPSWAWGQQAITSDGSTLTGQNGIGFVKNPGTGELVPVAIPAGSQNFTIPSPTNNTGQTGMAVETGPGVAPSSNIGGVPYSPGTSYAGGDPAFNELTGSYNTPNGTLLGQITKGGTSGGVNDTNNNTNTNTNTNTNLNTNTNTNTNNNQSSAEINISNPNPGPGQAARALGQLAQPPSFTPPTIPNLPSVPQSIFQTLPGYSAPNIQASSGGMTVPQAGPVISGVNPAMQMSQPDGNNSPASWNIQGGNGGGGGGSDFGGGIDPQVLAALQSALNRPQYAGGGGQMMPSGPIGGMGGMGSPQMAPGLPPGMAPSEPSEIPDVAGTQVQGFPTGGPQYEGAPGAGTGGSGSGSAPQRGGMLHSVAQQRGAQPRRPGRQIASLVPPPPPTPVRLPPEMMGKAKEAMFPTSQEPRSVAAAFSPEQLEKDFAKEWNDANDEADIRFGKQLYDARKTVEHHQQKIEELAQRLEQVQNAFADTNGRYGYAQMQARQQYQQTKPNKYQIMHAAVKGFSHNPGDWIARQTSLIYNAQEDGLRQMHTSLQDELKSYHDSAKEARQMYHDMLGEKDAYLKRAKDEIRAKHQQYIQYQNGLNSSDIGRSLNDIRAQHYANEHADRMAGIGAYRDRTDELGQTAADKNQTNQDANNIRRDALNRTAGIAQRRADIADAALAEKQSWHQYMAPLEAQNAQSRAIGAAGQAMNGAATASQNDAKAALGSMVTQLSKPNSQPAVYKGADRSTQMSHALSVSVRCATWWHIASQADLLRRSAALS